MQSRLTTRTAPAISKTDIAAAMPVIIISKEEAHGKEASQAGAVKELFCFGEYLYILLPQYSLSCCYDNAFGNENQCTNNTKCTNNMFSFCAQITNTKDIHLKKKKNYDSIHLLYRVKTGCYVRSR